MKKWLLWIGCAMLLSACAAPVESYSQMEKQPVSSLSSSEKENEVPSSSAVEEASSLESEVSAMEEPSSLEESSSSQEESSSEVSEAASSEVSEPQGSFAKDLAAAETADSMILVEAYYGTSATVSLHEKDEAGVWQELLSVSGYVGWNGVGQAQEGSLTTPEGIFPVGMAFGVESDPGCAIPYTELDYSHYWVDDPDSQYYNQFVSTYDVVPDWDSAEHLIAPTVDYAYCLEIGYNKECIPGAGSAMFLHCVNGGPTYGCVAIPRESMIFILQNIQSDTIFVIANDLSLY